MKCFFLLLLSTVIADIGLFKKCPTIKPMASFDKTLALGDWYETYIDKTNMLEILFWECTVEGYTFAKDSTTKFDIYTPYRTWFKTYELWLKGAQVDFPFANGVGIVNFLAEPMKGSMFDLPFNVLATDYDNYIIIHSCTDFGFTGLGYLDAMWVMNRTTNPS